MEKDFFDVFPNLKVKKELEELLDMVFVTRVSCNPSKTHIWVTVGAAGAINIVFKAILDIDDNVVVFRPYFGEYRSYASNFHAQIVEVDPQLPSFQPDLEDFARKVDARTKAVIIIFRFIRFQDNWFPSKLLFQVLQQSLWLKRVLILSRSEKAVEKLFCNFLSYLGNESLQLHSKSQDSFLLLLIFYLMI